MAHAAVASGATEYTKTHFMIRSKLASGLAKGTMKIGLLADDERLKMILPQACCYCGSSFSLTADHLIPLSRGGVDQGDNLVWACRSCNSSKQARDVLEWLATRQQFPPLLLLRRYLKMAIEYATKQGLLGTELAALPELPFSLRAIPLSFPDPGELKLWIQELPAIQTNGGS